MEITLLFIFLSSLVISVGVLGCIVNRNVSYVVFALMIISIVFTGYNDINFMSQEWYKSATYGFTITFFDLGAVVLFIYMLLNKKEFDLRLFLPFVFIYVLYAFVGLLSWIPQIGHSMPYYLEGVKQRHVVELGLFPLFETWKILRFLFAYWVIANFITSKRAIETLVISISIIITIVFFRALIERYIFSMHTVTAGIFHRHVLGHFSGIIGCFAIPFIFAHPRLRMKVFFVIVTLFSFICVLLTFGRSSLVGFVFVGGVVGFISLLRYRSIPNFVIALFTLILSSMAFIKAIDTILPGFNPNYIKVTTAGRFVLYKFAAQLGLQNPLGVGLGNFVAYSSLHGFHDIAHNVYMLNLAEAGVFGLFIYSLFFLRTLQMEGTCLIRYFKNDLKFAIAIAAFASILFLQLQDLLHFTSRVDLIAYLQIMMMALIARIYLGFNPYPFFGMQSEDRVSKFKKESHFV